MKHLSCCCCGCSLKAGTIIIGLLEFIPLLVLFGITAKAISETNYVEFNPTILGVVFNPKSVLDDFDRSAGDPSIIIANQILKIMICVITVYVLRVFLLLLGSCQEKLWMMIPWLGTEMCELLALPPFLIYIFVEFGSVPQICFPLTAVVLILTAISGYFFLVVLSHFEEIREKQAKMEMMYHEMSNPLHDENSQSTVRLA